MKLTGDDSMLILNACENVSFLATVLFIKNLIKIISYIIPAILVLVVSIDLSKAVMANSDADMKRAQKIATKRIIIALVIFFVPILVEASFNIIGDKAGSWTSCYNNATREKVNELAKTKADKEADKEKERQKTIEKTQKKQAEERSLREVSKTTQTTNSNGTSGTPSEVCSNCATSEKIAQTAELLAWPYNTSPTKKYQHNYPKYKH